MTAITIQLAQAPSSPLNLRFFVTYAPRVQTPPWVGYSACEVEPGVFEIFGYDADGGGAVLFRGALAEAYVRMAQHLRMDA